MHYLNDLSCCFECQNNKLGANPLNWEYLQGILTGENDALHFPVAYPAISFDKGTTKMFYTMAGILSVAIIGGFVISTMLNENKRLR